MELQLFQDLSPEERIEMLDAQADEVTEEQYLRPYEQYELNEKREEYVKMSLQMEQIKQEEDDFRAEMKERKDPLTKEMKRVLGNIKQGGENVRGKLYKIVNQDERTTGYYNEDGLCVSQRKALPSELASPTLFSGIRANMQMHKTGTDDE